ncbi:hypothetical protein AS9A_3476 [Hoyosella subflava DQS3-9A1]|uniref:Uncharacterized protein n=1 Tax=Hoyosella subflava (strain DSM 45089 / JCM 17490 / NBRC 109087 / DQS3-9A1) TaxID=443218 RepID=F6EQP0_HOYSD|nr:hypothetical protein AS9A_3476 [Hoyosella subflava DQS3-9A1]
MRRRLLLAVAMCADERCVEMEKSRGHHCHGERCGAAAFTNPQADCAVSVTPSYAPGDLM